MVLVNSEEEPQTLLTELQLVVSDMDGTLLGEESDIHHATHSAIDTLEKEIGIPFVLATGRCRSSALSRLQTRGVDWSDRPGIFLNGAVVHGPAGELMHEAKFDVDLLHEIVEMFRDELDQVVVQFCTGDLVLSPSGGSAIAHHLHEYYADPLPVDYDGYAAMMHAVKSNNLSVNMLSILTAEDPDIQQMVYNRILGHLGGEGTPYSVVIAITRQVAVLPKNTSKGSGVVVLSKIFQVSPKYVAAIGDGGNDISMLQCVGVPVAMGNAKSEVKKHAKYVVNDNNHETLPGVAQFLNMVIEHHRDS